MADWVLDSSAVLAVLLNERGGEIPEAAFPAALISTVNLAEVATRLIDLGHSPAEADQLAARGGYRIVAFDAPAATAVAKLRSATRHLGLSLGDRACLALAEREGLPVLTADRAWASLDIGVQIRLIR
ncbi:MAG TPA: type II toxin-antitoxin system VapC family toxin [Caulobacteraceae bacterium]